MQTWAASALRKVVFPLPEGPMTASSLPARALPLTPWRSCFLPTEQDTSCLDARVRVWGSVVWYGVMWCGVVRCGVVWCGVVWCALQTIIKRHPLRQGQKYRQQDASATTPQPDNTRARDAGSTAARARQMCVQRYYCTIIPMCHAQPTGSYIMDRPHRRGSIPGQVQGVCLSKNQLKVLNVRYYSCFHASTA